MNNTYHRDIVEVLHECGRNGCRIKNIARHIYNLHADLFADDIVYDEIRQNVGLYLWKQSQRRESPFCHLCYGTYALKADFAVQLDLFLDCVPRREKREEVAPKPVPNPHHIQLELF